MSKPMLATLPFVLLLLDYWPLRRFNSERESEGGGQGLGGPGDKETGRQGDMESGTYFIPHPSSLISRPSSLALRLVIEKLPLLALVAASCVVTVWAQRVREIEYGSLPWRIGDALISYGVYLRQSFWPTNLALLYTRRGSVLPPGEIAVAAEILLGITAAVWVWRRKCPYLLVGWLWYIGMLLPVIGLVPFGGQTAADRFTYLPQIGLCIAVAWAAADWCRDFAYRRWVCGLLATLALVALMGCAWQQTSYWRNSETLWTRTLVCTSRNFRVHSLLGNALALQGRTDEAVVQFQQTIAIKPDHADAQYGLGVAAASRGRMDAAIAHYRKAIAARPDFAVAHNNLGNALLMRGQLDEATKHF